MTLIHITLTVPDAEGTGPASGRMRFTPTRRVASDVSVMLPDGWTGSLDENGQLSVELTPSGVDWVWRVDELMTGGVTRYVAVPDSDTLEYATLTDVDPATLQPSEGSVPAWTEAVTQVQELAQAASASETAASASAAAASAASIGDQLNGSAPGTGRLLLTASVGCDVYAMRDGETHGSTLAAF